MAKHNHRSESEHPLVTEEVRLISEGEKQALEARLSRIEGQLRAIRRMVEEEAPCEAIAQQLAAARQALNKSFSFMLSLLLEKTADRLGEEGEERRVVEDKLRTIARVLARYY